MKKRAPTRKERELKRMLDEAMGINRNAASVLVAVRAERERARIELGNAQIEIVDLQQRTESLKEANDHLAGVEMARAEQHQRHIRKLFRIILDLKLETARQEGYIERVTDLDPPESHSGVTTDDPMDQDFGSIRIRDQILGAESENQRDRIIDSVDTETLDRALGAGDDRFVRP